MPRFLVVTVIGALTAAITPALAAGGSELLQAQVAPATQDAVVALADKYLRTTEPKLTGNNRASVDSIRSALFLARGTTAEHRSQLVSDLVTQLTMNLASMASLDAMIVSACHLVKAAPDNLRTANLFGSTLDAAQRYPDEIIVFRYVVRTSPREQTLGKLNLATAYLNAEMDDKGKLLLDEIVAQEPENKGAHRALAAYWFKHGNAAKAREELLKAAVFAGIVRSRTEPKDTTVEANKVEPTDNLREMERKLAQLKTVTPTLTADVIGGSAPDAARQIREEYGALPPDARMAMPRLPEVKVDTPKDFREDGGPVLGEWAAAFGDKLRQRMEQRYGANGEGDAAAQQQAVQQAKQEAIQNLAALKQQLEYVKTLPGLTPAQRAQMTAGIQAAIRAAGAVGGNIGGADSRPAPPPCDSATSFSFANFQNYTRIQTAYQNYLRKYFDDYTTRANDNARIYEEKVAQENAASEQKLEELERQRENGANVTAAVLQEKIRNKKALNHLAETYYKFWLDVSFPQYAQKMKPALDDYWATCMLYVRAMDDRELMQREYRFTFDTYCRYALMSIGAIGSGGEYKYFGTTDEEERALAELQQQHEEEAKADHERLAALGEVSLEDVMKWVNDHFQLEIAVPPFSFKVSPVRIEFEAFVGVAFSGIKFDFLKEKVETYTGLGAKWDTGIKICGVGAKVAVRADFIMKTASWDLSNGSYSESWSSRDEAKLTLGGTSVSQRVEVDSELNVKWQDKVSLPGGYTGVYKY